MPSPSIVAVNHHSHIVFWVFDSWHISLIDSKLKICINDCGLPGWFMLIWGSEIFQTPLYSQYMPIKPTCLLLKSLYWYPCHIFQHISKTKDGRKQLIYHKSATSTINPICCLGGEKEIQYIYIYRYQILLDIIRLSLRFPGEVFLRSPYLPGKSGWICPSNLTNIFSSVFWPKRSTKPRPIPQLNDSEHNGHCDILQHQLWWEIPAIPVVIIFH